MLKRFWIPCLCVIGLVMLVEAGIYLAYRPGFWDKTTWLLHDAYRSELFDRMVLREKLDSLKDSDPDVISVGDSSGFFSIQPNIVNRYLHGLKYVSYSTGANQAFDGYYGTVKYALEHQKSIKYVVLNMYPNLIPSPLAFQKGDLAPIAYDNLVGIKSKITPPSAFLSPYAKSWFFYLSPYHRDQLLSNHKVALELHYTIDKTLGWVPEHDIRIDRIATKTGFFPDIEKKASTLWGLGERSAILTTLNKFAELCRKNNVKLFVMFNPVGWQTIVDDANLHIAEQRLNEFQEQNPDVIFLTRQLLNPWDPAKFAMFNHVSREYVFESSARMGQALEKAIYKPELVRPFDSHWQPQEFKIPTELKSKGPAGEEAKQAALAFYLYTATADTAYLDNISERVKHVLAKNQPFQWMMQDTKELSQSLASEKIALRYDASKLNAEKLEVKNGYYCGDKKPEWIRISGTMQFFLDSPSNNVVEPVEWPASANIIIPIIREGNTWKFDGYCPAPIEDITS